MIKYAYYPGCTLKSYASNLEATALASAKALGVELVELPHWNCCGTVFSMASDDLVHQIAPMRVLLEAQKVGADKLVCVCSMCYNTIKQASLLLKKNPDKLKTLNLFLDDEEDYRGEVEVYHLLEIFRDVVGLEKISASLKKRLRGMKVSPYYGCLLVRPEEVAIDDTEDPQILNTLLQVLGAEVIDDPLKTECCGSYQTVHNKEVIADRTYTIINSARDRGAEVIALDCPLCNFNLDYRQKETEKKYNDFFPLPIVYYTQLLALALGIEDDIYGFDKHYVNPKPILEAYKLL